MRSRTFAIALAVLTLVVFAAGCPNPADKVPDARVGQAQAESVASGGEDFVNTPDSTISFIGSKITGSHDGGFNTFVAGLSVIDADPEKSSVRVVIDTTSLWSDNDKLTGHLKSPDFFDVATFPTATFTSTSIEKEGEGYLVTGNLDLHGVTRGITFPALITMGEDEIKVQAEFSIMRLEFGIVYPGRPDDLIRDEVVIKLDVVAVPGEAVFGE